MRGLAPVQEQQDEYDDGVRKHESDGADHKVLPEGHGVGFFNQPVAIPLREQPSGWRSTATRSEMAGAIAKYSVVTLAKLHDARRPGSGQNAQTAEKILALGQA